MVPLEEVTAQRDQPLPLRFVFDPFGHHAQPKPMGDLDGGIDDGFVPTVAS